jgi:hypothetical protein
MEHEAWAQSQIKMLMTLVASLKAAMATQKMEHNAADTTQNKVE